MTLLALDTATRSMSLALHDGQTLIAEQTWRAGNRHNHRLAPAIDALLCDCDLAISDLTAIAVATGPGSYTGLRIGVALAKGMAGAGDLPLVGVTTLDILAVAHPFQNARARLLAVVQAGRGRIIAGEYQVKKGRWMMDGEASITTWEALLDEREGTYYITGEIDASGHETINEAKEREGLSLTLLNGAHRARRAGFLAEEALRRLQNAGEDAFAPSRLLPIYMKSPDGT